MVMYTIAQVLVQVICYWAFFGALLYVCTDIPKFFKSKKWAIVAHGPLVWYAVFVAKITGELKAKDTTNGSIKR